MFGALITLVFGTYLGITAAGKIQSNRKARMEARAQGKKYYMTNKYVYHTVDTDEYCRIERESNDHRNHTVCVTSNGRVVEDYTVEKVEKYNSEIKEAGKKYYYIEDTKNSWVPVDKENGKPFRINIYEDYWGDKEEAEIAKKYDGEEFHIVSITIDNGNFDDSYFGIQFDDGYIMEGVSSVELEMD